MIEGIGRDLVQLVDTYSPTGKESQAVSLFNSYLRKCGATGIETDIAGNGLGEFEGDGMSVILCGHIDTVPGKIPVKIKDGIVYGRGAVDAKSSLISLLYGAMIAKESGFKGSLKVIAAVGEEGTGKGILEVIRTQAKPDYAIFGEPSGVDGITLGYRGRLLIDIEFRAEPIHASAPWMGGSSVDAAITAWSRIRELYSGNTEFTKASVALTGIHGGGSNNKTPPKSKITIDARYPPTVIRDSILREIAQVCDSLNLPVPPVIKIRSEVSPYVSSAKSPLAMAFRSAVFGKTGSNAKLIFKSGSGDMNILGNAWNIPMITYGPGNTNLSHTNHEHINIGDVQKSAEIVSEALLRLEGGKG